MERPTFSKRGFLNVKYLNGELHVQLNNHSNGSAVVLPLKQREARRRGDINLSRAFDGADRSVVNLQDLRVFHQSRLSHAARQERFLDKDLKIFHGATCRALATTNRCALLQSADSEVTGRRQYTLKLGTVDGGILAVPVKGLQFLSGGEVDLGAIVFHPQDTFHVVTEYRDTERVSRVLDDWKFAHILDPVMKAAVPFDEIQYRDPVDHLQRRLW